MENQCEKAKKEVSNRIDDLKSHLDVLHQELLASLSLIKENLTQETEDLNKTADQKTEKYENLIENVHEILNDLENKKDLAEKFMYECQDAIDDLKDLEQSYHKTMRKVSFEPSEWMPDEKFICSYIGNIGLKIDENGDSSDSLSDCENFYSTDEDDKKVASNLNQTN